MYKHSNKQNYMNYSAVTLRNNQSLSLIISGWRGSNEVLCLVFCPSKQITSLPFSPAPPFLLPPAPSCSLLMSARLRQ